MLYYSFFFGIYCWLSFVEFKFGDAEACRTMCYNDKSPRCKVVIEKDSMKEIRGIYKLQTGIINMTCEINSLPTPVNILWKYRPKTENKFVDVKCGNEQKTEQCNINEFGEHYTSGHCVVKTTHLNLSGFYRCEAVQENGILVYSNESNIEVVGIEYVKKVQDRLIIGRDGYIDNKSNEPGIPSTYLPYCYRARLVIGSVNEEDKSIFLIVRNEGETRTISLGLKTKSSSVHTRPLSFLCYILPLLISFYLANK